MARLDPDLAAESTPAFSLDAAGSSDRGRVRSSNQDVFFLDPGAGLFLVADGMGGASCGELASALTVACLRYQLLEHLRQAPPLAGTAAQQTSPCGSFTYSCLAGPDAAPLLEAFREANQQVFSLADHQPQCQGMGATASAVLLLHGHWVAANVGDSPIFLFRDDEILPLHTPHTLAEALTRSETVISQDDLARAQHILTRAMGVDPDVVPDHCQLPAQEGDMLCLCSDGLSNKVEPREMLAICRSFPAAQACYNLIALANARGGEDNITVVVCKCVGPARRGVKAFIHQWRIRVGSRLACLLPSSDKSRVAQQTQRSI